MNLEESFAKFSKVNVLGALKKVEDKNEAFLLEKENEKRQKIEKKLFSLIQRSRPSKIGKLFGKRKLTLKEARTKKDFWLNNKTAKEAVEESWWHYSYNDKYKYVKGRINSLRTLAENSMEDYIYLSKPDAVFLFSKKD